jgi:murein L,D-transpeptidase YcbB/YkuD
LERAWDVAKWIYGTAPQSNLAQPNRQVVIDRPVPVYITYFTAVPTASGFEFRDDFYNRDARAAAAIAARKTMSAISL